MMEESQNSKDTKAVIGCAIEMAGLARRMFPEGHPLRHLAVTLDRFIDDYFESRAEDIAKVIAKVDFGSGPSASPVDCLRGWCLSPEQIKDARRILDEMQHVNEAYGVGDVSKDPAYECPYCHGRNCEFHEADDQPCEGYFNGARLNSQFFCNDCGRPYNVQFTLVAESVHPNKDADKIKENGGENG